MKVYQAFVFLFLFGFVTGQTSLAQSVFPGLLNTDGTTHEIHTPNKVTGQTINVLDFGADADDNDNDDLPAITAAMQSAAFGDEIYFPNGVYNLNSTSSGDSKSHLYLKSGVNLRGEDRDSTILKSGFGDKTIDRFLKMRGLHDIVIAHLTLTSAFNGKYSTDTKTNNPQAGGPKYVISIEDDAGSPSYNITVDSVFVEKYRVHGVRLSKSHDVVVENSIFKNATDVAGGGAGYGVSIQGNKLHDNNSKFNLVKNCRFLGPYIRHGVVMQYATHNNAVRNNSAINTRLDAIDLHGEDEYLNEIYLNEVRDVLTGAGVGVGNTGSTHDASGPYNYIHDNMMINCREGVKVYLGSPDTRIENNIVSESTVSSGKGIYLLNAPRTIVKGNQIHDNPGYHFTGIYLKHDPGTIGKGVGDPQDIQMIGNSIYNNDYGIRIFAGIGIVMQDNDVHDNAVQDIYISSGVTFNNLLLITTIGSGTVQMDPPGGSYPAGTVVTLTAKRAANWQFSHWEGDLESFKNPDTIVVNESKNITAVFEKLTGVDEVALALNINGAGRVTLDPPGGIYNRGTVVTLRAEADSGWQFSGWSGDLMGQNAVDSLVLDSDKNIIATFTKLPQYKLLTWIIGSGQVLFDPPGGTYIAGTIVKIIAIPDSGWIFSEWGGGLSGSANPESIVVNSDITFTAKFDKQTGVATRPQPFEYALQQNFPNPFNPVTVISFTLKHPAETTIEIYDALGRKVDTILEQNLDAGFHSLAYNASQLPSGVYLYKLRSGQFIDIKKMILIK